MRVRVVYCNQDAAIAQQLSEGLIRHGIEQVTQATSADGLVVLMSSKAMSDPSWLEATKEGSAVRVVPVRVGDLDEDAVPSHLRELNWIDWAPERPDTTVGFVLAGLFSDPNTYRLLREIASEAETWDRAGRPKGMLVGDRGRAKRMREWFERSTAYPMRGPSATAAAFVKASDATTKKARRRRIVWRGGAAFALLTAISVVLTVIPTVRSFSRINQAALVTAGDRSIIEEMPEWAAANAAMLMLEGTATQRELGRLTLTQALSEPWALGTISFIDSIRSLVPYANGTRTAVVALTPTESAFAEVDVTHGRLIGYLPLPGVFDKVDLPTDERLVAVAGEGGAGVIPFRTRRFHRVASGTFVGVKVSGSRLVLWTEAGRLETVAVAGGGRKLVGEFDSVLDVGPDGKGGGTALVALEPGRYGLVDVTSGAVLSSAEVSAGDGVGTVDPGGRRAVVDAADRQLWTFGIGRPLQPTGISVPIALNDVDWASGERLALGSDSELGTVVYLPRGETIGRLCAGAPSVAEMRLEAGGDAIACGGDARSIWRLPAAPAEAPKTPAAPLHDTIRSPYAEVEIRGTWARVSLRGRLGSASAPPREPFGDGVTAAAFSPVGHQLALGSASGDVVVYGITRHGTRGVVAWAAPDSAGVSRLEWDHGFLASTASGQTWRLPDCSGCESGLGLVKAAQARFSGCFSDRQLAWINDENREVLGLIECEPVTKLGAG